MKKILAIVLALCLALSLSMTAFAVDSAEIDSPVITNPGTGSASGSSSNTASKYSYSVKTESGLALTAIIDAVSSGAIYDELKSAGIVAMYYVDIKSPVSADEIVSLDVYAAGVTNDCAVVVYDEWELGSEFGVSFTANGNRATITGPAGVFNTWHYVAIVSNADSDVIVKTPQESTDTDEEEENVDVETPDVDVEPEPEDNAPAADDSNPTTGIALAVVPMIVAAAAVVVSKKR